jgi:hypothetical protein
MLAGSRGVRADTHQLTSARAYALWRVRLRNVTWTSASSNASDWTESSLQDRSIWLRQT